jgi:hypothetical protein
MMSNPEDKTDNNDIFSINLSAEELNNQRTAVRYIITTDITLTVCILGLFSFSRHIPVKLADISSKGAAFECDKSIPVKKKIELNLLFEDKTRFTIPAIIIHKKNSAGLYGVKFNQFNNELGDYLLSSPNNLIFK